MRLLITGGAGFIGSHTVAAAQAAGHSVRVVDNLCTGRTDNLPPDVELIAGSVTDLTLMRDAMAGCDAVSPRAALVRVTHSLTEPLETCFVKTTGAVTTLEAARQAGVQRFILASTCAIFGDLAGCKDELSPYAPQVPYAASKLMAEQWAQLYCHAYAMETAVLRYFNVYGPRQRADSPYSGVLARWAAAICAGDPCVVFGDGEQTRDFVSVHDVAAANLLLATHAGAQWGGVYHVATGQSVSLNRIFLELGAILGSSPSRRYQPTRPGDVLHSAGDSSRLQQLGWQPMIPLHDGLAELMACNLTEWRETQPMQGSGGNGRSVAEEEAASTLVVGPPAPSGDPQWANTVH